MRPYILALALMLSSCSQTPAFSAEIIDQNKLCDAIKLAENSKAYPYGIKSINTHGDEAYARRVCLETVNNNLARWQYAVQQGDKRTFIQFLGDRYCPKASDSKGHDVWDRNVSDIYSKALTTSVN